ncbi:hypothetical protein [Aquimarina algiphila]|uniref:hypothetical protein n=1 Tax=Aquimarina algiphila TaxID=2047982 RepID=UPI00232E9344|nr:hypothetical protein [Aquimarina algiphila]
MTKSVYYSFLLLCIFTSCSKEHLSKTSISFYHWKSEASFNESYTKAIHTAHTDKIYLHYFDITTKGRTNSYNTEVFPTYVVKKVSKEYQDFDIVPVVYITNEVFKIKKLDLVGLSGNITKLIHQISTKHFGREIKEIQIDCDWTQSTRNVYFEFLKTLSTQFDIDVTIRLHQIKFKEETGVPPVKKGTLMVYNIGDLKNKQQNSILENTIVKQYINSKTTYLLPLHIGLPLFSQTVVSNMDDKIKIIKNTERLVLENDIHFKKLNEFNFEIVKDTLYKGFYLSKGYTLKLEELTEAEIIASYKTIKESKLQTNDIIFYHLDEQSLLTIDLKKIIEQL